MDDIFVDLRAAGLPTPSSSHGREYLAKQLGFSYKHLDNVMSARKPYGGRLKTTIRRWLSDEYLSAAKSEQTQPAPLSPLNQAEPDPVFAPVIERAEPDLRSEPQLEKRYRVVGRDVRVEQFTSTRVATFESPVAAAEYADWLNDRLTQQESG